MWWGEGVAEIDGEMAPGHVSANIIDNTVSSVPKTCRYTRLCINYTRRSQRAVRERERRRTHTFCEGGGWAALVRGSKIVAEVIS